MYKFEKNLKSILTSDHGLPFIHNVTSRRLISNNCHCQLGEAIGLITKNFYNCDPFTTGGV